MSSQLSRSRSLRKPAGSVSGAGAAAPPGPSSADGTLSRSNSVSIRNTSPSRLPVKPLARSVAPPTASVGPGGSSSRPVPLARVPSTSRTRATSSSARHANASSGSTTEPPRREASRYPPSTSATRLKTSGAASASGNGASSAAVGASTQARPRPQGHSRTKSSATVLTGSTILRPPSQSSSTATGPTSTRARAATHSRATSKPTNTLSAAPAPHHPPKPSFPPPSSSHASVPSSQSQQANAPPHRQTQQQPTQPRDAPRLRPAFSTLQQHYSPARNLAPKPTTASYFAPPSPSKLPANIAISAETSRLQNDLLRLHLIHSSAPATESAWHESARTHLSERFHTAAQTTASLANAETDALEKINVGALRRWMNAAGPTNANERVQALDTILGGLWALGEPGGKYARLTRRFEKWALRARDIESARKTADDLLAEDGEVVMVGDLDSQWWEDHSMLIRRLETWKRELGPLATVPAHGHDEKDVSPPSSLERVLAACGTLVRGMLGELVVMEDIRGEVVRREEEWMRGVVMGEEGHVGARAGAVWRVV